MSTMTKDEVLSLERRAHAAGVSIAAICRHADVCVTNWRRWKTLGAKPREFIWNRVTRAADELIAKRTEAA